MVLEEKEVDEVDRWRAMVEGRRDLEEEEEEKGRERALDLLGAHLVNTVRPNRPMVVGGELVRARGTTNLLPHHHTLVSALRHIFSSSFHTRSSEDLSFLK